MIRDMTDEERRYLKQQLDIASPSSSNHILGGLLAWIFSIIPLAPVGIVLTVALYVLTLLLDWILGTEISSFLFSQSINFLYSTLVFSAIFSAWMIILGSVMSQTNQKLIKKDLSENMVEAEAYHIVDSKAFREPEHGGILFFLRTDDSKILCLYDYDSFNEGVETGNAETTPNLVPLNYLIITHFPHSDHFFDTFSGDILPQTSIQELTANPRVWPEDHDWVSISWDEMDKEYAS